MVANALSLICVHEFCLIIMFLELVNFSVPLTVYDDNE